MDAALSRWSKKWQVTWSFQLHVALMGRNPSIALTEHANEVGARSVKLCWAYGKNFSPFCLLHCDAPAKVYIHQL
jgi:hypothetical protein